MKRRMSKLLLVALAATALSLVGCGVESSDPASEAELLASAQNKALSTGCSDPANCEDVTVKIGLDYAPTETSWTITNSSGSVVVSGGGYTVPGGTVTEVIPLDPGNYTFNIYDSVGDGLCCWAGWGWYELTDWSGWLASGGTFYFVESKPFTVTHPPPACLPAGASCTVDSQCCSGECRGKRTCT